MGTYGSYTLFLFFSAAIAASFNNVDDWKTNVDIGYSEDDFSAYNTKINGSSEIYATSLTTTDGNVTFTVPDPRTATDQLMVSGTSSVYYQDIALVATYGRTSITATFNTDITAFSTDILRFSHNQSLLYTGLITVDFNNNSSLLSMDYNVTDIEDFFITTNNGDIIDRITFGGLGSSSWVAIDNFSYGIASSGGTSPVPEPATMLLFGTGLAVLVGNRIRRKKK